jgi:hypothetical protein
MNHPKPALTSRPGCQPIGADLVRGPSTGEWFLSRDKRHSSAEALLKLVLLIASLQELMIVTFGRRLAPGSFHVDHYTPHELLSGIASGDPHSYHQYKSSPGVL